MRWTAPQGLQDALALITQSGERVRDTATKFSLVLSSTTAGPGVKAISDEMRGACDSLVGALGVLVDPVAGAGPPLMELYCQQVRAVLRATEELVKHITSPGSGLLSSTRPKETAATELAPRTGVVWAACEQLAKLPRSNKVAFRRAILQHQGAVSDTLREFQAMLDEAEGTDDEAEEGDGLDEVVQGVQGVVLDDGYDDLEDDPFGGSEALKAWERENVGRCLVALGHCSALLKGSLEAIDEATGAAAVEAAAEEGGGGVGAEVMEAVAGIEESCQGLAAAVVNAADALYPPQVRVAVYFRRGMSQSSTYAPTQPNPPQPKTDSARARVPAERPGGGRGAHLGDRRPLAVRPGRAAVSGSGGAGEGSLVRGPGSRDSERARGGWSGGRRRRRRRRGEGRALLLTPSTCI